MTVKGLSEIFVAKVVMAFLFDAHTITAIQNPWIL
jgi:hypothetical protein